MKALWLTVALGLTLAGMLPATATEPAAMASTATSADSDPFLWLEGT